MIESQANDMISKFEGLALSAKGSCTDTNIYKMLELNLLDERSLAEIKEIFELSSIQAVLFSTIFYSEIQGKSSNSFREISKFLDVASIEIFRCFSEFETLRYMGLIQFHKAGADEKITIKPSVFRKIIRNKSVLNKRIDKTIVDLLFLVFKEVNDAKYGGGGEELINQLEEALIDFECTQEIKLLNSIDLSLEEKILFLYVSYSVILEEENAYIKEAMETLYPNVRELFYVKRALLIGQGNLTKKQLICPAPSQFRGGFSYKLGSAGYKLMKVESNKLKSSNFHSEMGAVILPEKIDDKVLFYNSSDDLEIKNIIRISRKSNYSQYVKRLKSNGLPGGMTIILHGHPGTGKTELVYQLAKKTKRKIFKVDLSNVRDKWVGESEKRVAKIFDDYYKFRKQEKEDPILLLNECDGLLNVRTSSSDPVGQMNNTMQNILLEKLEDFDGILIATSNLIKNLDKAFERRFLIKLEINSPDESVRRKIMKSKLPHMDPSMRNRISKEYALTGAQIQNISKRWELENVLNHNADEGRIEEFIRQELMQKPKNNKREVVGYKKLKHDRKEEKYL